MRREGGDIAFTRGTGAGFDDRRGHHDTRSARAVRRRRARCVGTFRSTRGDRADAKLAIGRVAGAPPGRLAPEAPLEFSASGDIPTLQILQPWIGSAAVVSGPRRTSISRRAARSKEANLSGAVLGEDLRIDAPQYGVHYTNGRLAVRAAEGRVAIDEITLGAGDGTFRASGEITGLAPGGDKPVARLTWKAEKFRAFNRPDLHLVVGGEGTAVAQGGKITLSGKLAADEGIDRLPRPHPTRRSATMSSSRAGSAADQRALRFDDLPLVVDLSFDLGDRLTFSGEGIETRLAGAVRVTTGPSGLIGKGSIRTVRGTYFAFGQRLDIDRGQLVFDGPLDNPGLDIVALRRNLAVEAGVAVTGTVKVPVIQLTSNPPVPDSEKLSWLVLGQAGSDLVGRRSRGVAGRFRRAPRLARQAGLRVGRAVDRPRRHHVQEHGAQPAQPGAPGVGKPGHRRRQATDGPPDARLRAGTHHRDQRVAARIRADALADAAGGSRNGRRARASISGALSTDRPSARRRATGDNVAAFATCKGGCDVDFDQELDTRGLSCPLPILKTKKSLNGLASGQVLKIVATDPGSVKDMQAFAKQTGHALLSSNEENKTFVFYMRKK